MLLQLHTIRFQLVYCIVVIVCHFVRSLMAFVCQEIKGLLTYLRQKFVYCSLHTVIRPKPEFLTVNASEQHDFLDNDSN